MTEKKMFIEKFAEKISYILSYLIFTLVLYLLLDKLDKIPVSWTFFHIGAITLGIVLTGSIIRRVFL